MKHYIILPLLLASSVLTPAAYAQEEEEEQEEALIETGWFKNGDGMSVHHSGITLPQKIDILKISTNEQPKSGINGLDNLIQYVSGDSDVFASIYIYRPAYADAELTSYMTNTAIRLGFGTAQPDVDTLSSLANIENAAIVKAYKATGKGLATAAAFAQVGQWIIKIRVSGPQSEYDQVMQIMNASLATIKLDDDVKAETLSLKQPTPCIVKLKGSAKNVKLSAEDQTASALFSGLLGSLATGNSNNDEDSGAEDSITKRVSFNEWCVADSFEISGNPFSVFRSIDEKDSAIMFPFSDAGHIFITTATLLSETRSLSLFEIGSISNYGEFDSDLSTKQYSEILTGNSNLILEKKSQNTIKADGNTTVNIFTL